MDDLAAWLTQIWDELEVGIREALRTEDYGVSQFDLDRIAADRQILARYQNACVRADDPTEIQEVRDDWGVIASTYEGVLCILALPYADRPGYQQAWKP